MLTPLLAAALAGGVTFQARMPAEEMAVGGEYAIAVEAAPGGAITPVFSWEAGGERGGLRRPILQLDVPGCVELIGSVPDPLRTPGDFQLDFLRYPWGRRLMEPAEQVRFRLVSEPGPDDAVGLNLVVYPGTLGVDSAEDSGFERLRADLPLRAGASAAGAPSRRSDWGPGDLVQIGDEAPDFTLPKADGSELTLSQFRGHKNVLLVTYRRET